MALFLSGCNSPSKANIELRKENQELRDKIEQLQRERAGDQATIKSLQESKGTVPSLPQDRVEKLFTVHGIRIERLSGGAKIHAESATDDALKIYITPTDESDQALKAAGSFVVEAFDLKNTDSPSLGRWEFSTDEARKNWFGSAMLYEYVLTCPLTAVPTHNDFTVHVTFTDELTGRKFEAQKVVNVTTAPAPAPVP